MNRRTLYHGDNLVYSRQYHDLPEERMAETLERDSNGRFFDCATWGKSTQRNECRAVSVQYAYRLYGWQEKLLPFPYEPLPEPIKCRITVMCGINRDKPDVRYYEFGIEDAKIFEPKTSVKWSSWEANFWFRCKTGVSPTTARAIAKRKLAYYAQPNKIEFIN